VTPQPTTTTTATPTPSPPPGGASAADIQVYLQAHNAVRAKHGAAPLTWSADVAAYAQKWANGCKWAHSDGPYGGMFLSIPTFMLIFLNDFP
jgi:uncharacterized protein YkwD